MSRPLDAAAAAPDQVGFFLVPKFQLLAFSGVLDTLRMANFVSGRTLYELKLFSEDGSPVRSSNDISVAVDAAMNSVDRYPVMIVCGGAGSLTYRSSRTSAWLRKLARNGSTVGAIGLGAYQLARAGILDGYRCTLHWEEFENFSAEFPKLQLTNNVFEIDRGRMTCPGGTAPINMTLKFIEMRHGRGLVGDIADELIQYQIRDGRTPQRMDARARGQVDDARLEAAISAMESNLEEPLNLDELSKVSGLSLRHLQRRFLEVLGRTPVNFYRELRLQKARRLLMQGSSSVLDVAVATGFASGSYFTRSYRKLFGRQPRKDRAKLVAR